MNNISNNRKGFTLIELLVVIGIIALLSSIVLSSLTKAKAQANNTKQIADYKTVLGALIQFKQENGYYPTDTTQYTCIGNYSDNSCIYTNGTIAVSSQINNSLKKYLSSYNFIDQKVPVVSGLPAIITNYKGFLLKCSTGNMTQCPKVRLLFPALKNKNSCPQIMSDITTGEDVIVGIDEYTLCSVDLN